MNSRAFTLLEVIFAMVLLLSTITAITRMQFNAILRVWKGREDSERIFLIYKVFQDNYMKISMLKHQDFSSGDVILTLSDEEQITKRKFLPQIISKPEKKIINDPKVNISSQLSSVSKKSELKNFVNRIKILRSDGEWQGDAINRSLGFVGFVLYFDEEEQ
jgi:hypothetical protein